MMKLYFHPLSSYSQKALIALYEKNIEFTPEIVDITNPEAREEYRKLHPLARIPLLVLDDGRRVPEATIIIEYLQDHHASSGTELIPTDKDQARRTRFQDRLGDCYLNEPTSKLFFDSRRPEGERDPSGVKRAKATLGAMLAAMDKNLTGTWIMGDAFSMADCAVAPCLGYLRMVHPYEEHKNVTAYFQRMLERPSYKRVLEEAAPYMARFTGK